MSVIIKHTTTTILFRQWGGGFGLVGWLQWWSEPTRQPAFPATIVEQAAFNCNVQISSFIQFIHEWQFSLFVCLLCVTQRPPQWTLSFTTIHDLDIITAIVMVIVSRNVMMRHDEDAMDQPLAFLQPSSTPSQPENTLFPPGNSRLNGFTWAGRRKRPGTRWCDINWYHTLVDFRGS